MVTFPFLLLGMKHWERSHIDRYTVVLTQAACDTLVETSLSLYVSEDGCRLVAYAASGASSDNFSVWYDHPNELKRMSMHAAWVIAMHEHLR